MAPVSRLAVIAAACLWLSGCAVTVDRSDVFFMAGETIPTATLEALAAKGGASSIQPLTVQAAGRSFLAYRATVPQSCGTLLFFTGNGYGAGPVLTRILPQVSKLGLDLAVMNYGMKGEDYPTVAAVFEAALRLRQTLRAAPGGERPLYIAGHSLGGWVSLHVAGQAEATGVVIAGAGSNARDVGYAVLPGVIGALVDLKPDEDVALLDSPALGRAVEEPLLVLASRKDHMMSPAHSEAILAALPPASRRRLVTFDDVGHSAYYGDPRTWAEIAAFFGLPKATPCAR